VSKKCKICKKLYLPRSTTQQVCSFECSVIFGKQKTIKDQAKQLKAERSKVKQRKEALKSLTELANEAQIPVNKYIRLRDKHLPCISCGKFRQSMHCGHYRSRKAAPHLRFNENNMHSQCAECNTHLSGNQIEYRINLVKKIGLEAVEQLENDNRTHKYTREELIAIKKEYQNKCKLFENN
jgi:hypothetical protein